MNDIVTRVSQQDRMSYPGSVVLRDWNAKRQAEKAAAPIQNNVTVYSSNNLAMRNLFGDVRASSGYPVTEHTAMRVSAVFAAVRLISSAIASLPLSIYRRTDEGREKAKLDDLWFLLNEQACPTFTAASMWEWVGKCNQLRGDGYCQIIRKRDSSPKEFKPWHPDRVRSETKAGRLQYYIQPQDGKAFGLDQDDMLHFPGFGFDGERSMSVIQHAAYQAIGIGLAADDFSGKFYANGASPKHLFETQKEMTEDQIDLLRKLYGEKYTGPENVGKPMVLTEGLTIKELSMSAIDAQLLDSRKFQVIDIARAFGVPPHMIGAQETTSSWGTGIEQLGIAFVNYTLQPYLNRYKQELNRKLFRTPEYFVEFNLDGLLRGDSKAEGEALRQMLGGSQGPGYGTANEVRRIKNLPPIKGGDTRYIPKGKEDAKAPAPADS